MLMGDYGAEVLTVSYTHLDVYKRQQQRRGLVEKKGAVHAAGEGHQRSAAAAEQLIEPLFFFPECGACKYIPEQGRLLPSLSV